MYWKILHFNNSPTYFEQKLNEPSRDAKYILEIFSESIEHKSFTSPSIGICLKVINLQNPKERNRDFLSSGKSIKSNILIDRLCNRLGSHKVNGICELADHRPEFSWRFCVLGDSEKGIDKNSKKPPWLLSKPVLLKNKNKSPEYNGPLELHGSPCRVESGWWDGFDVARDYFIASNPKGDRLWVFYNRRSGQWFLHGFF